VAHIVRYEVFERPSHPQDGPLHTIALDLPRDQFQTEFWPAIQQQTESIRSFESLPRDTFERTDFPQQSPLYRIPVYTYEDHPAITQLSDSYWLRSTLPLDKFERTDFAHAPPLYKVPEGLLGAIEFYAAWHSQSQSFRTDPEPKLDSRYYPQPAFSWLTVPLVLQDPSLSMVAVRQLTESFRSKPGPTLDPRPEWVQPGWIAAAGNHLEVREELTPACSQQIWSFRSDEGARLVPQFYTQPEFSWIDGALGLEEAQQFMVAVGQLTNSFRVPDHAKLIPQFYTQPAFTWLSVPLNLFNPQDGVGSACQQAGSFRTRESLPVDKFERTDFPQGTPLLTIPLDLPRDLFETQFIPAIYQQTGSFRSLKEELLTGQHLERQLPYPLDILSIIRPGTTTHGMNLTIHIPKDLSSSCTLTETLPCGVGRR